MRVKTGTYTGNGTAGNTITGVGFQPDVVFIKSAGANDLIARTKTMRWNQSKDCVSATLLETGLILSFDPGGFTIGSDNRVNQNTVAYYWLALQEGPDDLKCFTYIGNGSDDRPIPGAGFTPALTVLLSETTVAAEFKMRGTANSQSLSSAETADRIQAFEADGIQVGTNAAANSAGVIYHGVHVKSVAGLCAISTYTGTGVDGLGITGVGFQPAWLLIKRQGAGSVAALRESNHVGDSSALVNAANAADIIQSLDADGFSIGTHASVNASAGYNYVAFAAGTTSSAQRFTLSNRDISINLDDNTYYGVAAGGSLGTPNVVRQWSEVWGRGYHPLGGVSYGNRTIELTLQVRHSALDGWAVRSRLVHQVLRDCERYQATNGLDGLPATLWVQLNGMTNEVIYDVFAGDLDDSALEQMMIRTTAPGMLHAKLSLTVKPFGRPQNPATEISATLTNGAGVLNLATIPGGDMPASVSLTFTGKNAFQRVIMGRKSRGTVENTTYVLECEPGTYGKYTVGATPDGASGAAVLDSSAHGGVVWVPDFATNASGSLTYTINSNVDDWYGRYRVFLKRLRGAAEPEQLRLSYGGSSGDAIANTTFIASSGGTATGQAMMADLGLITIPARMGMADLPPAQFKFRIDTNTVGNATAATGSAWDCIYLIPVDEYYADLQLAAAAASAHQLVMGNTAYLKSASGQEQAVVYNVFNGQAVEPRKANRWDILSFRNSNISTTGAFNATDTFTLQADHYALYNRFYATSS